MVKPEKQMTLRKISLLLIIAFSINSYSQKVFKENGNREYSDTLNIKLLSKALENLEIKLSNVYPDQSHSIDLNSDKTFFALQYILKNTEDGNLCTTKYLYVNNSNGKIIDHVDNKNSFYDTEAVQSSPSYILKNKIKFNEDIIGIGIITEESVKSCATIYSQQKISIIGISNNKIKTLLDSYPIRKTHGESNCSGNYQIEVMEKSIDLMKDKTNGLFNLLITKRFSYEDVIEENLDKKIQGKKLIKNKTEIEKLIFNGVNYNFKEDEVLRFLKY